MTPERLNQIETRLTHSYTNADVYRDPLAAAIQDVDDLLDYIDELHEALKEGAE